MPHPLYTNPETTCEKKWTIEKVFFFQFEYWHFFQESNGSWIKSWTNPNMLVRWSFALSWFDTYKIKKFKNRHYSVFFVYNYWSDSWKRHEYLKLQTKFAQLACSYHKLSLASEWAHALPWKLSRWIILAEKILLMKNANWCQSSPMNCNQNTFISSNILTLHIHFT